MDLSNVGEFLVLFRNGVVSFFGDIFSVFGYILNILKTIWFGMTSLLTSVYQLAVQFFSSGFFS